MRGGRPGIRWWFVRQCFDFQRKDLLILIAYMDIILEKEQNDSSEKDKKS